MVDGASVPRTEMKGVLARTTRVICLVGGVFAAAGGGCDPGGSLTLGNLDFLAINPPGLINTQEIGAANTFAYGASDLGPVPNQSLPTRAVFQPAVPSEEAVVFAIDPSNHELLLQAEGLTAIITDDPHQLWDFDVNQKPGEITWPPGIGLTRTPQRTTIEDVLTTESFYGLGATAMGIGSAPAGAGSVKAAVVYDHGSCSQAFPIAAQIAAQTSGLQSAIASQPGISVAEVEWLRAANFIDHQPGDIFSLHGGIFVAFHIDLLIAGLEITKHVRAFAKYNFDLDDIGRVFLDPPQILLEDPNLDDLNNALSDVSDTVSQTFLSQQYIDVFAPRDTNGDGIPDFKPADLFGVPDCDDSPGVPDPCFAARTAFGASIAHDGAQFGLGFSASDAQIIQNTATNIATWSCFKVTDQVGTQTIPNPNGGTITVPVHEDHKRCKYFLPVKRLLFYPDKLEAVFFDGPRTTSNDLELKNPAFALWAAVNMPLIVANAPSAPNALCSFTPVGGISKHPWVSVEQHACELTNPACIP